MTRIKAKELLPAITHFAKGGDLWCHNNGVWCKQTEVLTLVMDKHVNIIEDKYYTARKAYALGEEIEYLNDHDEWIADVPEWQEHLEYRPKPKEKFEMTREEALYKLCELQENPLNIINEIFNSKTEPSKKLKKDK